ncbi:MAG: Na(+)-translocating NADH-quinone reductase subunit A [Bacteroidales bacterium]|nr:Na(+)-translocating NADH-quinone reductase subunit A [Bacteroidales bacterium]
MDKVFRIRKGADIELKGKAKNQLVADNRPELFALKPIDFFGLVPKLSCKEGGKVKQGECVFFDKYRPDIVFVAPVNGVIKKVVRGEKRKMLEIIIEKSDEIEKIKHNISQDDLMNEDAIKKLFLKAGIWPYIKQRPYGIVANPDIKPRDIFISMFDSAPLAPDFEFILRSDKEKINLALKTLKFLTDGDLYLSFSKNSKLVDLIDNKENYKINYFNGPHPAGLHGVQINKIKPINKGEIVWTLNATDLPIIGGFLETGIYNPERIVALAGSEVSEPAYFKTIAGADLTQFLKSKLNDDKEFRVISGNVLTGTNISQSRFLSFFDNLVTVIPEGNKYELFGWVLPGFDKLSLSNTFMSKLFPRKKFAPDTNLHGGKRAYVVTGQYESVCPIDVYPQLLIKAILAEDIDKMEQMGIYEIIDEDFALCEFACTSKMDVQEIVRTGLNLMMKEMS